MAEKGDMVGRGQLIGIMAGRDNLPQCAWGYPHLHFGVFREFLV